MAQRRPRPEQVELARWYLEEAPADLDEHVFTRRLTGHDYSFYDVPPRPMSGTPGKLLGMWEWQQRVGTRELVEEVEIQALRLGEVAVAPTPSSCSPPWAGGSRHGLPSPTRSSPHWPMGGLGTPRPRDAFRHGGYEPCFAYQSRLPPEAGELMTDAALDLLARLAAPH